MHVSGLCVCVRMCKSVCVCVSALLRVRVRCVCGCVCVYVCEWLAVYIYESGGLAVRTCVHVHEIHTAVYMPGCDG